MSSPRRLPISAFLTALLLAVLVLPANCLASDSLNQQLTDLDQQFDSGQYEGSVRDYLEAESDLIDEAGRSGEDLAIGPDPEPVDIEGRVRGSMQARQATEYLESKRQEEQCAQLAVICPDEPLAQLASAAGIFSIADATDTTLGLEWEFTERIDRPMTLGEFAERQLKQTGANYLGYMGVGLVVFGAAMAAEAAPAALLGGTLASGGGASGGVGAGVGVMWAGSVPELVVAGAGAGTATGGGGWLAGIASHSASRYVLAAAAGASLGTPAVAGTGGLLSSFSFGPGTYAVAGLCGVALLVRGCGNPRLSDDKSSNQVAKRPPVRPGEIDIEIPSATTTGSPLRVRLTADRYSKLMRAVESVATKHRGAAGLPATEPEAHNQLAVAVIISQRYPKMFPENVARVAQMLAPRRPTGLPPQSAGNYDVLGFRLTLRVARDNPQLMDRLVEMGLVNGDIALSAREDWVGQLLNR